MQNFKYGYDIEQDLNSNNTLYFEFELLVPAALVPDGAVVYQYAQFRESYYSEWTTVACKDTIGSRSKNKVINFSGFEDMTGLDSSDAAVAWDEQSLDSKIDEPGYGFYSATNKTIELEESTLQAGYVSQWCTAHFGFTKFGLDESWVNTYKFQFGARIYADESSTLFVEVPKTVAEDQKFTSPTYEDEI
jgi:hypothetical protein